MTMKSVLQNFIEDNASFGTIITVEPSSDGTGTHQAQITHTRAGETATITVPIDTTQPDFGTQTVNLIAEAMPAALAPHKLHRIAERTALEKFTKLAAKQNLN